MPTLANAHALVVGVAAYQRIAPLPATVVQDARDVRDLLVDPARCGYPPENVQLLLDGAATRAAIRGALADIAKRAGEDSTVFIYLSGHGGQIEGSPAAGAYLLPVDVDCSSEEALIGSAISGSAFTALLRAIPARKVVVAFDCCHAGGIGQPKDAAGATLKAGLPESYYDALKSGRGRVIVASSRGGELSWVLPGARNSLFTQHLLDGLRGAAPGPGGVIRIFDLFDYLQPRVTKDQPNQHPIFKAELEENFAVALFNGGKAPAPIPPAPAAGDGFANDVFVSYRRQDPDKTWARKTLIPRLKAEGLKVIDDRDFALGLPEIENMQRAVEQSRYTLSILTPAYLGHGFSEFQSTLAQHLGLEQGQRRFLGVIRTECNPSLSLRMRTLLDMTDDEEFETDVARLIYGLSQSAAA
jgi:hypothetical protein